MSRITCPSSTLREKHQPNLGVGRMQKIADPQRFKNFTEERVEQRKTRLGLVT